MEEAGKLPNPVARMTQLRNEFQRPETYKYGYFMQASRFTFILVKSRHLRYNTMMHKGLTELVSAVSIHKHCSQVGSTGPMKTQR